MSDSRKIVLFHDGTTGRYIIRLYNGAAMIGQPTAYVIRSNGSIAWVVPGEASDIGTFVEAEFK